MCSNTLGPANVPSLLICPIKITGTLLFFAKWSREAVHSLICGILPGEESTVSVDIV